MLGLTLVALFLTSAAAALVVLADGYVRGRNAYAQIRRDLMPLGQQNVRMTIRDFEHADDPCSARPRAIVRPARSRSAQAWRQQPVAVAA